MIHAMELAKVGKEVFEASKQLWEGTQLVRWNLFLYGCRRQLQEQGDLTPDQDLRLVDLFSNDYARQCASDFIRRAIESNSEISQLALARLYVRCASRRPPHATYDESILMNAYRDLDDRDVCLLLCVVNLFLGQSQARGQSVESFFAGIPENALEMSREQFQEWLGHFEPFNCKDVFDLRDSMEQFATRRAFQSTVGLLASNNGTAFSLLINSRSQVFIDDLRWARDSLGG